MKYQTKILALAALLATIVAGPLGAEQSRVGESEFKSHCAGCHGLDGKGSGPFVEFLKTPPRSLTTLAKENQGVFPFQRIYEVIDGANQIGAHGTQDMPLWGQRYATEIVSQYGEFGAAHPQTVRCRILELVFFLSTLQERQLLGNSPDKDGKSNRTTADVDVTVAPRKVASKAMAAK